MEQTVTLQIFGRKFTFQTESGVSDAKKVAAHFEDAVKKVQSQFDGKPVNLDKETILILTGLNIASEHFKLEERYHQFLNRVTKKSAVVLSELEKAIS
ncbi:MAG: cell division protein ZapA [Desulfosarcina sp.]|nr:cell division protein ZapA [Desulfosarcina sp.]MBC2741766.1 cell division protein ZapA [Desulfosarcina sp.]MBC2764680.1 cell division protein ZapA [Desulfosarcina sp.]